jgi:pentapeptide repeat protein
LRSPSYVLLVLVCVWSVASWLAAPTIAMGIPVSSSADAPLDKHRALAEVELIEAQRNQAQQTADSARDSNHVWRVLLPIGATLVGALFTAYVAYLAIVVPLREQREKDRSQRLAIAEQQAQQQRKDLVQRFGTDFTGAVAALADPNPSAQVGAAAALRSFLRPELSEFREQTYQAIRAHLDRRIEHVDAVRAILVAAFGQMLREMYAEPTLPTTPRVASIGPLVGVDLTHAWLRRADLRCIDLAAADFWRCDLRAARLDGSSLRRSRGWKADMRGASFRGADLEEVRFRNARARRAIFDDARLVSARFEEAELDGARFRGAKLQSAHFVDAGLRGADFRDADVRDAQFVGARFDDASLASLLLARNLWKVKAGRMEGGFTARLDSDIEARLRYLAAQRGWHWVPARPPSEGTS